MKNKRQEALADIISSNSISSQKELVRLLDEAGYTVAQPTLSRDLAELGVTKNRDSGGTIKYILPDPELSKEFETIFLEAVEGCRCAGNILVIKCRAGAASAACASLDSMHLWQIVGTIAGDDTIFAACQTPKSAEDLMKVFSKVCP